MSETDKKSEGLGAAAPRRPPTPEERANAALCLGGSGCRNGHDYDCCIEHGQMDAVVAAIRDVEREAARVVDAYFGPGAFARAVAAVAA